MSFNWNFYMLVGKGTVTDILVVLCLRVCTRNNSDVPSGAWHAAEIAALQLPAIGIPGFILRQPRDIANTMGTKPARTVTIIPNGE